MLPEKFLGTHFLIFSIILKLCELFRNIVNASNIIIQPNIVVRQSKNFKLRVMFEVRKVMMMVEKWRGNTEPGAILSSTNQIYQACEWPWTTRILYIIHILTKYYHLHSHIFPITGWWYFFFAKPPLIFLNEILTEKKCSRYYSI